MYQRKGEAAYKNDLSNIILLSDYLQQPHNKFKSVHIAGTNGKGSTSHMMASVLQEAGYCVGLYTSPHLKDFRERIKVNGAMVSQDYVIDFVGDHKAFFENNKLSFFEMTVGMAFSYFADQNVDIAIIEVGLGGRLDATNIIIPELSIITNIGKDHTQFLGETLPEIAREKGGIIKENVPVVIGEFNEETEGVFSALSRKRNAQLFKAYEYDIMPMISDLKGTYQELNKGTVQTAFSVLQGKDFKVGIQHIAKGLRNVIANTGFLGRWQILQKQPLIICDTAHNKEGLTFVMEQLRRQKFKNLHIVLGVVSDKDLSTILPLFPTYAFYYFCKPEVPRGLDVQRLKKTAEEFNLKGATYSSVAKALEAAKKHANADDVVFIGGSTFVVAEVV